jgi:AcrR family transcriptional regulator
LAIARLEPHVTVEAGVSIGNIYNYYKGKEESYLNLIQRYELPWKSCARNRSVR